MQITEFCNLKKIDQLQKALNIDWTTDCNRHATMGRAEGGRPDGGQSQTVGAWAASQGARCERISDPGLLRLRECQTSV